MKLEDQICSLELAIRLKELGVKQNSLFDWYCQVGGIILDTDVRGKWIIRPELERNQGVGERCSAFTVAELGGMLPQEINSFWIRFLKYSKEFEVGYWEEMCDGDERRFSHYKDEKESDARAKMLIHLLEEGLVNPKEKP